MTDFEIYKTKVPYPDKPAKPFLSRNATVAQCREHVVKMEQYGTDRAIYLGQLKLYHDDVNRLELQFKQDAIRDVGLDGHEKADAAFSLAWAEGHSAGLYNVYDFLVKLADLIL